MSSEHLIEIIILALFAGFLVHRLRSVLGRRTGHQRPSGQIAPGAGKSAPNMRNQESAGEDDNVVPLPGHEPVPQAELPPSRPVKAGTPLAAALVEIKVADPSFVEDQFLSGAARAFHMIVEAFAGGDRQTLENLLAPEVYQSFLAAIDSREAAKESLETRIEALERVDLHDAKLEDGQAFITVRVVSQQVNVTRDADGQPLEGEDETAEKVVDLWTFQRDTRSSDPTWYLVATDSPE